MATTKPPAKTAAAKTSAAPKAVKERPRVSHFLVLPAPSAPLEITDLEPFTGEIAARRALDARPGWRYVALAPGQTYSSWVTTQVGGQA